VIPSLKATVSPDEVKETGDEPRSTLFSEILGGRTYYPVVSSRCKRSNYQAYQCNSKYYANKTNYRYCKTTTK